MRRIVNGTFGDSFDTMTEKPYVIPGIKIASINKAVRIICHVTIICHDTTTSKNPKFNLLWELTFKLLD